jgi:hypothetical protein
MMAALRDENARGGQRTHRAGLLNRSIVISSPRSRQM